jgi:hypothetical protein
MGAGVASNLGHRPAAAGGAGAGQAKAEQSSNRMDRASRKVGQLWHGEQTERCQPDAGLSWSGVRLGLAGDSTQLKQWRLDAGDGAPFGHTKLTAHAPRMVLAFTTTRPPNLLWSSLSSPSIAACHPTYSARSPFPVASASVKPRRSLVSSPRGTCVLLVKGGPQSLSPALASAYSHTGTWVQVRSASEA